MKFDLQLHFRNIPDVDLLDDLLRVSKMLGKNTVTVEEYGANGKFSADTIIRRFNSWVAALRKAGLGITKSSRICNEELFQNLEEVWQRIGRQPTIKDMRKPNSKYYGSIYAKRFGGWNGALLRFMDAIQRTEDTKENELINEDRNQGRRHKTKRDISWHLRFQILKRDSFKCVSCGNSPSIDPTIRLEVDHIIPWTKGGETISENLQTLCQKCNQGKSNLI